MEKAKKKEKKSSQYLGDLKTEMTRIVRQSHYRRDQKNRSADAVDMGISLFCPGCHTDWSQISVSPFTIMGKHSSQEKRKATASGWVHPFQHSLL
jgi:hypothetical protein